MYEDKAIVKVQSRLRIPCKYEGSAEVVTYLFCSENLLGWVGGEGGKREGEGEGGEGKAKGGKEGNIRIIFICISPRADS